MLVGAFLLYVLNEQWIKPMTLETTLFFHHFFNDLLALTLLVAYVTIFCTLCVYRYFVTFWTMLALVAVSALFWEYVTPLYLERSTSDPLDLLMYIIGYFIYWPFAQILSRSLD
jgi:hypothetical protein